MQLIETSQGGARKDPVLDLSEEMIYWPKVEIFISRV